MSSAILNLAPSQPRNAEFFEFLHAAYTNATGAEIDWPQLLHSYLNNVAKIHLCPTDRSSKVNSYALEKLLDIAGAMEHIK